MGLFSFGKRIKHRRFDYIPRYYDQEKEEREQRLRPYLNKSDDDLIDTELAKDRIRAGFRQKYRAREDAYAAKTKARSNRIILLVFAALIMVCYVFLTKYLPQMLAWFE